MPGASSHRTVRPVVFVEGVRTPFGRARRDGLYAHTRADDLAVKTVRELLRRHPELPPGRVDEVALAPRPPARLAMRSSSTETVGLVRRE